MKSLSFISKGIIIIILLAPITLLAFVYKTLPQKVALHFGLSGQADRYGDKSELVWGIIIVTLVSAGTFLLLCHRQQIDPQKGIRMSQGNLQKTALAVVTLFAVINILIIFSAGKNELALNNFFLPFIGLFIAFMGNLMQNLKPNYFVGIRTPWTLEDRDTWRKTHQLAGKLWFGAGLIITIATLLVPLAYRLPIFLSILGVAVLIPVFYSYTYYKKHKP